MTSTELVQKSLEMSLPIIIVSLMVDGSNIILNGIVAHSLKRLKKYKIVSYWFIYCLCISDILVGITGLCFHSTLLLLAVNPFSRSKVSICQWFEYFGIFFRNVSGCMAVAIGVDRLIRFRYLHRYHLKMKRTKAHLIILLVYALSALSVVSRIVADIQVLASQRARKFVLYVRAVLHVIVILVFPISYIMSYRIVKRRVETSVFKSTKGNCLVREAQSCNHTKNTPKNDGQNEPKFCDAGTDSCFAKSEDQGKEILRICRELRHGLPQLCINDQCKDDANQEGIEMKIEKLLAVRSKPENEILKYTCFALVALVVCYMPNLSLMFHSIACGTMHVNLEAIFSSFVLLYSSINAMMLLFFSKELQIFVKNLVLRKV